MQTLLKRWTYPAGNIFKQIYKKGDLRPGNYLPKGN